MTSVPTLAYWDTRARGEPIRYLLRYVGVKFIDKRYPFGPGNTMAEFKSIVCHWLPQKYSFGLDFPNLPYYIEGDLKLTQSTTIIRYLARKHGLIATDEQNLIRQELVEQQVLDMNESLWRLVFNKDYEQMKQIYIDETLTPQLEAFAKFLGSNKWVSTDFSYADIMAYEFIDRLRLFTPETIEKFPTLGQYLTRFESLKPIKEYQSSPQFKKWPIYAPALHWGYKK